ncbi:MAG: threonine--tRNA ligase [Candidatus Pacebacteria bacterium CG10_big_fil_rev_8_21_14_0_10_44_11]|nr:MAG: threonine--tRNA ligase [Candidatus Pacebacteria bacterium CG10_big_fil_rev_8_21_14_0_10_44_11]
MPEDQKKALEQLRHSAAHLLAAAVVELWPQTKLTIGPATEDGFYYDFECAQPISDKDLPKIEEKMRQIVKNWQGFERQEVSAEEAKEKVRGNQYKLELIDEIVGTGEPITFYRSGQFEDLCRGGHVDNPVAALQHFKLLSIAGAYWRGDEKNTMLTRIYGTAFFSAAELEEFLKQQEEAKLRDHRKLGRELELFFIDEMVGKGLVMWLPKGTIIRDEIEKLVKEKEAEAGYLRVATPHIAKAELYLKSGHLPYYKDSMYPPMVMDDGTYYLRAMNCPHHHRIFQHASRSYREMPLRLAEYGTCYRNELSGTLAGLLRVRAMTMNDAHIYCTKDQIKSEFASVLRLTQDYFAIFGLKDYWFRLSKWDPAHTDKYINQPENWEYSEQVLREVLQEQNVQFVEADDEAAFYGPKVDVQFKSVVGREETMSTIQLDFVASERFGLSYVGENGEKNSEVFVIHRAPLSVHERFLAFLLEHYAGAFPVWLSPVQVKVLPITDRHQEYANEVAAELRHAGVRVEVDGRSERLQAKIRDAQLQKVPLMAVVGDKETEQQTVAVRNRDGGGQEVLKLTEFVASCREKIEKRENSF